MISNRPLTPLQIKEYTKIACEANGMPDFWKEIKFKWLNKLKSRAGDASKKNGVYLMRLSIPLFSRATEEQKKETVIHEVCHLINFKQGLYNEKHGDFWRTAMIRSGYPNPQRCHKIDRTGLYKPQDRIEMVCDCRSHAISKRRYNSFLRGTIYRCNFCRSSIRVPIKLPDYSVGVSNVKV